MGIQKQNSGGGLHPVFSYERRAEARLQLHPMARTGISTIGSVTVLLWGLRLGFMNTEISWVTFVSVALVAMGAFGFGLALHQHRGSRTAWLGQWDLMLLVGAVIGFLVWSYLQILLNPAYGTDEMSFDQYAAQLLLHGINPYTTSMAPAFNQFFVSPDAYTYTLTGQAVTALSYPSLSFLMYIPAWILGIHQQAAVWTDVFFWVISMVMAFYMVRRELRPLIITLFSFSVYVGYAVGGVTDSIMLPFLLLTAYQWDRYVVDPSGRWWQPIAFGLAMAVKQTPWFLAPILLVGLWREAQRHDKTSKERVQVLGRYTGLVALSFFAINAPFWISSPIDWVKGILTPLFTQMVPSGQGLVGLSVFTQLGGGNLHLYNDGSLILLMGLWVFIFFRYERLKTLIFFTPVISFFFADRSFASYLVNLLPMALVAVLSQQDTTLLEKSDGQGRRSSKKILAWISPWMAMVPGLALLLLALVVRSPLQLTVQGVSTTGQFATIDRLQVAVHNRTRHDMTPYFSVDDSGQYTTFWNVLQGPAALAPDQTASYELQAPNTGAMPSIQGGFQVVAFTAKPSSVSESASYVPSLWHATITPAAVDQALNVGQAVTLYVHVLNRLNIPIEKEGIPVYLGQVIYAQSGLIYAETQINQGNVGQTPVEAFTNAHGVATFIIHAARSERDPVYFEANLVNSQLYYPYGYSNIVSVLFQ